MSEIYVVVSERDVTPTYIKYGHESKGGLVFEQYTENATLEHAKEKIKRFDGDYGKCRIAKLVFIDEDTK